MKECFKCKLEKPLLDFYKHKKMGDGYLNKCKECTKKDVKSTYIENKKDKEWIEKERLRGRKKYHKYKYKPKKSREINTRHREKYPEKHKATNKVSNAIRSGILKKQPCRLCREKAHAHHFDYSKPLAVIWYCPKHHSRIHRFMRSYKERTGDDFIPERIKEL